MKAKKTTPAGDKSQLGTRIPRELYKRLAHYAIDQDRGQAEIVAEALDEYLKKRGA